MPTVTQPGEPATSTTAGQATLTVAGAARFLGVHVNTVRAWTDQGRLPCLRINSRGDRRYSVAELERFVERAGRTRRPAATLASSRSPSRRRADTRQLLEAREERRRAERLLSIGAQIGSRHELRDVLAELLESAIEFFDAESGAVFSRRPGGGFVTDAQRNVPAELREAIEAASSLPLVSEAYASRAIVSHADYQLDPRSLPFRRHLLAAGINTISVAPLVADGELLGALALYHDRPYRWRPRDRQLFAQLAEHGANALRNARLLSRTATWAAQLQSIQQLGVALNGVGDPRAIGRLITDRLSQLIDYDNVRVYRVEGDDVVPLAWQGHAGVYVGEDGDQLRLKLGQGITGWVARHGVAQRVGDAARDPRAMTIPGTEEDLDESLLVAPMLHEDEAIGVLVLAKLGLDQFTEDDQRLLEIFAAIAAQAMANADATERLREQSERLARQLASQRELLRVTESILSTLDRQALLDEIADRLAGLMPVDNISVDLHDETTGTLRPIFARGGRTELYLARALSEDADVSGHVLRDGQPMLVHEPATGQRDRSVQVARRPAAVIVLPLRGPDRIKGVLTIERLGAEADFSDEEFELAKLFGGHVSIALSNADLHHAAELRAQTDALTGLLNHGALLERLAEATARQARFALLMVDLDHFKRYNDRLGHRAGDALLQQLADVLRAACRSSDEVFRYGGDEFALLLADAPVAGALAVAEMVRRAVRGEPLARQAGAMIGCSIGVATYPADGRDRESILLAADRACYVAKRSGRDRIATAAEGLSVAGELQPPPPTPVDVGESSYPAA